MGSSLGMGCGISLVWVLAVCVGAALVSLVLGSQSVPKYGSQSMVAKASTVWEPSMVAKVAKVWELVLVNTSKGTAGTSTAYTNLDAKCISLQLNTLPCKYCGTLDNVLHTTLFALQKTGNGTSIPGVLSFLREGAS